MSGTDDRATGPGGRDYSVRVSDRARQVRLVMKAGGLEVVIPRGYSRRAIPELVESRRAWIERSWRRVQEERRRLEMDPPRLPRRISLPALAESWVVEYRCPETRTGDVCARDTARARGVAGYKLLVSGDRDDYEDCKAALCRWLGRRGRQTLVPRLAEMADRLGFEYEGVSIRQQRTRWGSCSRLKRISLNAKLLLMKPEAVDYVLLHELCHTVRMDHSQEFWSLVERHDPDYRAHRKLVKDCGKTLPTWLDHAPDESLM